jgi:SAM-dependent methyltransferase
MLKEDKVFFSLPNNDLKLEYPDDDKFRKFENWTSWRKKNYLFYLENLKWDRSIPQSLLDLGSGRGQFLDLYRNFEFYVGLDFAPYESVSVISNLTEELPFHPNIFDYLVASNVLEHLSEATMLINEAVRVIKPGGKFLGTVPFLIPVHQAPYDFVRLTPFALKLMLERAGFDQIKISALNTTDETFKYLFLKFWQISIKNNPTLKNRFLLKIMHHLNLFFLEMIGETSTSQEYNLGFGFSAVKSK